MNPKRYHTNVEANQPHREAVREPQFYEFCILYFYSNMHCPYDFEIETLTQKSLEKNQLIIFLIKNKQM